MKPLIPKDILNNMQIPQKYFAKSLQDEKSDGYNFVDSWLRWHANSEHTRALVGEEKWITSEQDIAKLTSMLHLTWNV